ncbi:MAG TPA: VWA domain-containing protein [Chthoniobacterales bacterium]
MTMNLWGLTFGQPWWLLLLLGLPVLAWLLGGEGRPTALRYSSANLLKLAGVKPKFGPRRILGALHWAALALVIVALAQPRKERGDDPTRRHGIDVMLLCDVSPSMDWTDFTVRGKQVRRLDALREAVASFLDARPNDRTGMIVFSSGASIVSPLTLNNKWLADILTDMQTGGTTAIGEGIYAATDLLKQSEEKSKVIILITDGGNVAGRSPFDAAKYAKSKGVRIYSIAIADLATMVDTENSDLVKLTQCSQITGGQVFKATDTDALVKVYREIDRLEKHKIEQNQNRLYTELFPWVASAALVLGMLGTVLSSTVLLRMP